MSDDKVNVADDVNRVVQDEAKRRYLNDPSFSYLVNSIRNAIFTQQFTAAEIRQAIDLAEEIERRYVMSRTS